MNRTQAEELLRRTLAASPADDTFVALTVIESTRIPVAGGHVFTPVSLHDASLAISLRRGRRYASCTTNALDPDAIRTEMQSALARASLYPEAGIELPFPGPVTVAEAPLTRFDMEDAAEWRVDAVRAIVDIPRNAGLVVTGAVSTSTSMTLLASTSGLLLHQPASSAHLDLRVFSESGRSTGAAEDRATDFRRIDPRALAEHAVERCREWSDPIEIEPTRLTTVFDARALAETLHPFITQFDEQAVRDERSFLRRLDGSSRLGQELFDTSVTLRSDPYDPDLPSMPFTLDGLPVGARTWVRNGVIESMARSRVIAHETQRDAVSLPTNLIMEGGDGTLEDLIAGTKRGLLVRGFASLAVEDPANCLLNGSTRDGVFLIENGVVTRPVRNLVMRETPLYFFKRLEARGRAERCSPSSAYFPMRVPPIRVTDVMYTHVSGIV